MCAKVREIALQSSVKYPHATSLQRFAELVLNAGLNCFQADIYLIIEFMGGPNSDTTGRGGVI